MSYHKVQCLIKDEKVGIVQRMLDGLAYEFTAVPVKNMKMKANGQPSSTYKEGKAKDLLLQALHAQKITKFDVAKVQEILTMIGRSPMSSASMLTDLTRTRLAVRDKKAGRGHYILKPLKG